MTEKFRVGDVVVMINDRFHDLMPKFYPEAGTVGKVRRISDDMLLVAWATGSTSDDDTWYISSLYVKRTKRAENGERHMTNREWMQTLTDEEFYDAMLYVITKLSFSYTNSRLGVIEWLSGDYQEEGDA